MVPTNVRMVLGHFFMHDVEQSDGESPRNMFSQLLSQTQPLVTAKGLRHVAIHAMSDLPNAIGRIVAKA